MSINRGKERQGVGGGGGGVSTPPHPKVGTERKSLLWGLLLSRTVSRSIWNKENQNLSRGEGERGGPEEKSRARGRSRGREGKRGGKRRNLSFNMWDLDFSSSWYFSFALSLFGLSPEGVTLMPPFSFEAPSVTFTGKLAEVTHSWKVSHAGALGSKTRNCLLRLMLYFVLMVITSEGIFQGAQSLEFTG